MAYTQQMISETTIEPPRPVAEAENLLGVASTNLLAVVPGVEYYWRRTEGWNWFGVERWWQVFVVFADGMNGGGGACIEERWRWNGSSQTMRRQPRNLTYAETVELLSDLSAKG